MNKTVLTPFNESDVLNAASTFDTPFYLLNETGIREACKSMKNAFSWNEKYINFYAVKANPNPHILKIIKEEGFGVDCSSLAELKLAHIVGFESGKIMYTSNGTHIEDYLFAKEIGAILNIDDISHIDYINEKIGLPEFLCFRYNPGKSRSGNTIIGNPCEAKFGLTYNQVLDSFNYCKQFGVKRFGIHSMVISNTLDANEIIMTAMSLFQLVKEIYQQLNIEIELVNIGGGFGVPYKPTDIPLDVKMIGEKIHKLYSEIITNDLPNSIQNLQLSTECGRYIMAMNGILVTRVLHHKNTYKKYISVDSCMADFMRCAMYGAYHSIFHIPIAPDKLSEKLKHTLPSRRNCFIDTLTIPKDIPQINNNKYDVVGSLCENNDKFAIDRTFKDTPLIGDLLVIQDTGAHGLSMGFNYNGKLRAGEILLKQDGTYRVIRRKENFDDLTSTIVNWNLLYDPSHTNATTI